MVFQIGVILVSTMETSCKDESVTGNDTLFTVVSKLDRPVFAVNFLK